MRGLILGTDDKRRPAGDHRSMVRIPLIALVVVLVLGLGSFALADGLQF
jgi:hypothetical protein